MVLARIGPTIHTAVRLAKSTGRFASGRSVIDRYAPPHLRKPLTKVVSAFEQASAGAGLYQIITDLKDDGTPSDDYAIQKKRFKPTAYKQRKAYYRQRGRFKCRCNKHERSRKYGYGSY